MAKTLSIGITTFRNRLNEVSKQVEEIRAVDNTITIILAINTNYRESMPEDYRLGILNLCIKFPNIYPVFFTRFTGLAKMWNTLINHCSTSHIFVMNDDISFRNPMALNQIRMEIQNRDIFTVNSTFGTYVISKEFARKMNYFDERLIAFGEEDGEFWTRYEKKYGKKIEYIQIPMITNRVQNRMSGSYDTAVRCHQDAWGGFKPTINKEIIEQIPLWQTSKQYPYEEFIDNNFHLIGEAGKLNIYQK